MKDMKAARRMQLTLLSAIVIVGLATSGWLMYSLHSNVKLYDAIFTSEVAHQDEARVIQVTFKKQVQEWKNVLLRGSDYEALSEARARASTTKRRSRPRAVGDAAEGVTDSEASKILGDFLAAHDAMRAGYGKRRSGVCRDAGHQAGRGRQDGQGPGSGADGPDRQARRSPEGARGQRAARPTGRGGARRTGSSPSCWSCSSRRLVVLMVGPRDDGSGRSIRSCWP